MKKVFLSFIMIFFLLFISGCSNNSYYIERGNVSATSHYIEGSYKTFDGDYHKNIKLEEGDIVQFHFESTTNKGTILSEIYFQDQLISTIQDKCEVTIDTTGTYEVTVIADNHSGSFKVSWEIK
ncbi:hypothetical protein KHQ81_03110 [Mycoplasmatota bacterium]|nr:hypothetical protein KHQ81_03110 [Mycoplasmatota bacterium]